MDREFFYFFLKLDFVQNLKTFSIVFQNTVTTKSTGFLWLSTKSQWMLWSLYLHVVTSSSLTNLTALQSLHPDGTITVLKQEFLLLSVPHLMQHLVLSLYISFSLQASSGISSSQCILSVRFCEFSQQRESLPFHRDLSQSLGQLLAADSIDQPHDKTAYLGTSEGGSDETWRAEGPWQDCGLTIQCYNAPSLKRWCNPDQH